VRRGGFFLGAGRGKGFIFWANRAFPDFFGLPVAGHPWGGGGGGARGTVIAGIAIKVTLFFLVRRRLPRKPRPRASIGFHPRF